MRTASNKKIMESLHLSRAKSVIIDVDRLCFHAGKATVNPLCVNNN
jgi:hypothetical protein